MVNGKPGDDPVSDLLAGREHSFPEDVAEMICELNDANPHLFTAMFSSLNLVAWSWEKGEHLPEARTLLTGLIAHPGDSAARGRLLREYRVAVGMPESSKWFDA